MTSWYLTDSRYLISLFKSKKKRERDRETCSHIKKINACRLTAISGDRIHGVPFKSSLWEWSSSKTWWNSISFVMFDFLIIERNVPYNYSEQLALMWVWLFRAVFSDRFSFVWLDLHYPQPRRIKRQENYG